ncbi:MAG: cation diffusion facilitator family transporter [Candidatus Krumholzibacteria bacterium]|nr:cation diffusion facilitator family transporter [Candidatus Krumholzibacteria bacterium]
MTGSEHDHHAHPPDDFGFHFHYGDPKHSVKSRLVLAIWLNVGMMVAEFVGGILTNSLALLSDAGHMFTHIFALVVSYVAVRLSARGITRDMTFGYHRAEPIAALINAITILIIVVIIVAGAVKKFIDPVPIQAREMFIVAVAGLIVNLVGAFILKSSAKDDINIKGAFIHLLTDLFSSVAIVIGGAVIIWTGWELIDPILSLFICAVVGVWGWRLLRESTAVLMEAAPRSIDVEEVSRRMSSMEGVRAVHDVHVWEVSSGLYAMTCHVLVDDMPLSRTDSIKHAINRLLSDEYRIGHTNLQFEPYREP